MPEPGKFVQPFWVKTAGVLRSGWLDTVYVSYGWGQWAYDRNTHTASSHVHPLRRLIKRQKQGKNFIDFLRVHTPTDAAAHQDLSWYARWPVHHCLSHSCHREKKQMLTRWNSMRETAALFFLFGSFGSTLLGALCWLGYSTTTSALCCN